MGSCQLYPTLENTRTHVLSPLMKLTSTLIKSIRVRSTLIAFIIVRSTLIDFIGGRTLKLQKLIKILQCVEGFNRQQPFETSVICETTAVSETTARWKFN